MDAANLLIKVDSTQVKTGVQELDRLTTAGTRAEQAVDDLSSSARRMSSEVRRVTVSAGQARAGAQQLSYQIGDVAQQFALGARPAQIFAQQVGQVVQAVQMMTGATRGFIGFLSGPWGAVLTGAVVILASFASAKEKGSEATKKATKEADRYTDALGRQLGALENVIRSEQRLAAVRSASLAIAARQRQIEADEAAKRLADAQRAREQLAGPGGAATASLQAQARLLRDVEQGTKALQEAQSRLTVAQREARAAQIGLVEIMGKSGAEQSRLQRQIDNLRESIVRGETDWDVGTKQLLQLNRQLEDMQKKTDGSSAASKRAAAARREQAQAEREATRAAREAARMQAELQTTLEGLERQFDPMAAEARRFNETLQEIERVRMAGLIDDAKALLYTFQASVQHLDKMREKMRDLFDRTSGLDPNKTLSEQLGIDQAFDRETQANIERTTEQLQRANDALMDMARYLQYIGGFSGVIGGIVEGLTTGDFGGIGPAGVLINVLKDGADALGKQVEEMSTSLQSIFGIGGTFARTLAGALQGAAIGTTAASAVFGASNTNAGAALGGALGQVAGAAIGKTIGGALGSALGPIGSIAGSLLGNLVGGLFSSTPRGEATISGGIITVEGNKRKFEEAANAAAGGVLDALNKLADDLGGWVDTALGAVTISNRDGNWRVDPTGRGISKVSNGAIDFGEDYEAAVAFAVQDLIKDGVLKGLRQSTLNLLTQGDNFEEQLRKALAFEAVFQELEAASNPLMAQVRELQRGFQELTAIFVEAGATAEEFAALQQLQAQQMKALIDAASANYRATFYTDAENVDFAKQVIKDTLTPLGYGSVDTVEEYKKLVESVDTSTEAGLELYGTLMDLSDEFATLKQAAEAEAQARQQIAQQRAALEVALLQAQGKTAEAVAKQRAMELAAMDKSLHALARQVWHEQDVAAAKENLLSAYRRESQELENTATKFRGFAKDLREFRDSLFTTDSTTLSRNLALANLMRTGGLAAAGDEGAIGELPGVARTFLGISKDTASSLQQYQRDVALVARYVDQAALNADTQATIAEQQLAEMKSQVGALVDIEEEVQTVAAAIEALNALTSSTSSNNEASRERRHRETMDWAKRHQERLDRIHDAMERNTVASNWMQRFFQRAERPGGLLGIFFDEDAVLRVRVEEDS